jgi:hypothetical protein
MLGYTNVGTIEAPRSREWYPTLENSRGVPDQEVLACSVVVFLV